MKPLTDEQIIQLKDDFHALDFNQPQAHKLYREMKKVLDAQLQDPKVTTWREFRIFNLGCIFSSKETDYLTKAPL